MKFLSILSLTAVGLVVPFIAAHPHPTFYDSGYVPSRHHARISKARAPGHAAPVEARNVTVRTRKHRKRTTCAKKSSSAVVASSTQASSSAEISATPTVAAPTSTIVIPTSSSLHTSSETSTIKTTHTSTKTSTSSASNSSPTSSSSGSHQFTFVNKCSYSVNPKFADTSCGYSPRCPAGDYTAAQPATLAPGATSTAFAPYEWVGRVFNDISTCGPSGEDCTILEFNLDAVSQYTPNSYDISNIQGFTQSISLGADGCDTVTCTNANCGTTEAYAIGDLTGGGADYPVRACGAGPVGFTVVFCP